MKTDRVEVRVARLLTRKHKTIAVAESCTGGLVSKRLTDVSGSSRYFKAGIVTYSDESKENFLGVPRDLLERYGAVSKQVALEMAGRIKHFACVDIGIGITGIAGPTGGSKTKPIGLVYIALVTDTKRIAKEFRFKGSREEIRVKASEAALELIRKSI